jgi:glycosyltransferase involved in cell wall biosynthesis
MFIMHEAPDGGRRLNILCPGISAWSWMVQRPQQLLRAAARAGHRCFYVEPASGPSAGVREVEPGVLVYSDLAAAARDAGGAYTLYFTNLMIADRVAELRAGPVLFDAVDDFPGMEAQLARCGKLADHVICTSQGVRERLQAGGIDAALVPNACDYAHWASETSERPLEVDVLPTPRAVFIGAVAQWVDVGLVAACAEAVPDAAFLLIGPHLTAAYRASGAPTNVWAFGIRPYATLPLYAHAADVLLLPFREDQQEARAANPVKLWEYLATGRPIVSTSIPEVLPLDPLVRVASGQDFVAAVRNALRSGPDDGLAAARRRIAAENTWDQRWRQIEEVLAAGHAGGNRVG